MGNRTGIRNISNVVVTGSTRTGSPVRDFGAKEQQRLDVLAAKKLSDELTTEEENELRTLQIQGVPYRIKMADMAILEGLSTEHLALKKILTPFIIKNSFDEELVDGCYWASRIPAELALKTLDTGTLGGFLYGPAKDEDGKSQNVDQELIGFLRKYPEEFQVDFRIDCQQEKPRYFIEALVGQESLPKSIAEELLQLSRKLVPHTELEDTVLTIDG